MRDMIIFMHGMIVCINKMCSRWLLWYSRWLLGLFLVDYRVIICLLKSKASSSVSQE